VFVEGEYWTAVSATPVAPGETVEIVGLDGLTLEGETEGVREGELPWS